MLYTPWRIEMLGRMRAVQGDRVLLRFGRRKTTEILAYLAFHMPAVVSREKLIDLFWNVQGGNVNMDGARKELNVVLSELRRLLNSEGITTGALLTMDNDCVGLDPLLVSTDVAEFENVLNAAFREQEEEAERAALIFAIALYQGDLLPGDYNEWTFLEQERLKQLYLSALHRLINILRLQHSFQ